jgi:hypothetical protein
MDLSGVVAVVGIVAFVVWMIVMTLRVDMLEKQIKRLSGD